MDWTKPIRFTKVQNDDHVAYQPRYVGKYLNENSEIRHVVVARFWDSATSFLVYDDDGTLVSDIFTNRDATKSTGIYDATLVNGPEIVQSRHYLKEGIGVILTMDGDKAVGVRLA